jgi:hypothetical protein
LRGTVELSARGADLDGVGGGLLVDAGESVAPAVRVRVELPDVHREEDRHDETVSRPGRRPR